MGKDPTLITVTGPTAAGKTAAAISLARHFGTVILSADSRQIYRQMDIGTAKPTAGEMAAAKHYFIDILDPDQPYSAGQYERDALALLETLFQQHEVVILAGGSGFYVDAVWHGLDELPKGEEALREELMQAWEDDREALLDELRMKDEETWMAIDRKNPHRVVRAMELIRLTGKPLADIRRMAPAERPFRQIKLALSPERADLYEKINRRVDLMVAAGLPDEVRSLIRKYPQSLQALQTVGYQELIAHFNGLHSFDRAIELIKRNTRRFAKRQMTWFRRYDDLTWFPPDDIRKLIKFVEAGL